jgi:AcrR family transcriptional regulator
MSQKQRILEGAFELFMQAGIKSVTMDDIAKHLGMSKKTIYQHFSDKNELVVELVKERLEHDKKDINDIMAQSGNVIEKMLNMMKCSEDLIARMNPIVMHDMQKYHSDAWKEFQAFKAEIMVDTLVDLLNKGKEQGYIRPEIDAKIMALMRVAQIETGFNNAVFPYTEFNVWTVQQQFFEHFNYGICTLKGYKLLNEYQNINQE